MFWNPIFREFRGVLHFSAAFLPSLNRHAFRPPFTKKKRTTSFPRSSADRVFPVLYLVYEKKSRNLDVWIKSV